MLLRLRKIPVLLLVVLGVVQATAVLAQRPPADSVLLATAVAQTQQRYATALQDQAELYSGQEYVNYTRFYQEVVGNQFFVSGTEQPGTVQYDGYTYSNIPLLYDIRQDQLIIKHPTSFFTLKLDGNKTRAFQLHGHNFIRVVGDSTSSGSVKTGYYDLLLDGPAQLLAHRAKRMLDQPKNQISRVEFSNIDELYIRKDALFYPVTSKSSLLKLFPEQRKHLQKYIQENKLKFSKATKEADVTQLMSYYLQLPAK